MVRFQSYQFRQINPDDMFDTIIFDQYHVFQSYQFRQINPDSCIFTCFDTECAVSIVSIQADQSRLCDCWCMSCTTIKGFNRINSGRSIPTQLIRVKFQKLPQFQSYQFRQINPDLLSSFNIAFSSFDNVSIVSIQADQSRHLKAKVNKKLNLKFQSYQFRQINPDYQQEHSTY